MSNTSFWNFLRMDEWPRGSNLGRNNALIIMITLNGTGVGSYLS